MNREEKRRTLSDLALNPELPAHQAHELTRDRQTQSGAAVFACGGRIGLGEHTENLILFVPWNPDPGIPHAATEENSISALRILLHIHPDFTSLSEFDRVTGQIHKDLKKPARVPDDVNWHVWSHIENELQTLLLRSDGKYLRHLAQT